MFFICDINIVVSLYIQCDINLQQQQQNLMKTSSWKRVVTVTLDVQLLVTTLSLSK